MTLMNHKLTTESIIEAASLMTLELVTVIKCVMFLKLDTKSETIAKELKFILPYKCDLECSSERKYK